MGATIRHSSNDHSANSWASVAHADECPFGVNRVGLTGPWRLPLCPRQRTSSGRPGRSVSCQKETSARKQAMKILVASLLANASFSESLDDVVVLTTKLRIARTCVAYLLEPLDGEVRSDFIQFGQHLLGHFQLAGGSIG